MKNIRNSKDITTSEPALELAKMLILSSKREWFPLLNEDSNGRRTDLTFMKSICHLKLIAAQEAYLSKKYDHDLHEYAIYESLPLIKAGEISFSETFKSKNEKELNYTGKYEKIEENVIDILDDYFYKDNLYVDNSVFEILFSNSYFNIIDICGCLSSFADILSASSAEFMKNNPIPSYNELNEEWKRTFQALASCLNLPFSENIYNSILHPIMSFAINCDSVYCGFNVIVEEYDNVIPFIRWYMDHPSGHMFSEEEQIIVDAMVLAVSIIMIPSMRICGPYHTVFDYDTGILYQVSTFGYMEESNALFDCINIFLPLARRVLSHGMKYLNERHKITYDKLDGFKKVECDFYNHLYENVVDKYREIKIM